MDPSSPNSGKLTPEIARRIERQLIQSLPTEIPADSIHFLPCDKCGVALNFDGDHAIPTTEYACALMQLWAAVKNKANWRIGYNPAFTEAVARLHKLEAADGQQWRDQADGVAS